MFRVISNISMDHFKTATDIELTDSLQKGSRVAFTEIYNRYWDKLFSIAGHKLDHLEDAEEVVQDIFIALWNRRDRLNITKTLNSYLAVSVKYRVIKILDKQYHQKKYVDSCLDEQILCDNSTQQWLEFMELKERLENLVVKLPEKCKLVYKMSREDGSSHKEIALALNISEKTVEAHLAKATEKLRTGLNSYLMTLL